MATISSSFYKDANRVPITNLGLITKKTVTFAGATTNAWGDDGGTLDGGVLFTVTGLCKVQVVAVCPTLLDSDGAATLSIGISGDTAIFTPAQAATTIDAGEIFLNDTTPATYFIIGEETAAIDNLPEYFLNGNDIILTVAGAANVTAGVLDIYVIWTPISTDGNIVDAGL